MVGQTDAGETIYEARSARLVLRGDAAHFNRLVRCSKCGREVVGRAVLGPADLDQPPQAVVCSDCVEAATVAPPRPGPRAEPVATDEPAVADAQAEMRLGIEGLVDELGGGDGDAAEFPGVMEPAVAEGPELDDELGGAPPADDEPLVNLQLMDDVAAADEDGLPAPDEDEALMAATALDETEAPALGDDDVAPWDEDELPAPGEDEAFMAGTVLDEIVAPAPAPGGDDGLEADEPVRPAAGPPAVEPPAPADDGLVRRIEALEERLALADHPDPLRLVALEETVHRLNERADAQASLHVALQARIDEIVGEAAAVQARKEGDKLRRRLDQMGERLEQLQATVDAEWVRATAETATLGQTVADLGGRVNSLAEQSSDTAGAEEKRVAAVEAKVDETADRLSRALEAQRQELQDGLQKGLADVLAAVPPAPEDYDARFRALERQVHQSRGEVSELNELHAALDAGLGTLRAEIGDVRMALSRVVDSKADLEDRLETFVRMSLVPEGDKGRKARKTAESTLGTLSAAVQDLLREQRQLKDSFATLEHASDAATAAAARASTQASSLAPLRTEVKLLHQELVEHQQALDALRRTVARLRQPPPPPAAATPTTPAKKAPAAKAAAAPAAKRARTGEAAPAKAATAAKATPAVSKTTPAKKA